MLTAIKNMVLNTWRADPEWQLASLRKNKFLLAFCWGVGKDKGGDIVPGLLHGPYENSERLLLLAAGLSG